MGLLDELLRSTLSQAKVSNPLMLALLALLGSGALFGGSDREAAPTKTGGQRVPADEGGGLLEGLGGLLEQFRQSGQGKTMIRGSEAGRTTRYRRVSSVTRSVRTSSRRSPSGPASRKRNSSNSCRRFCRASSTN